MTQVMTPSDDKPITKGQIGKLYDVLADALVKSGLPSKPVQQVLATRGAELADEFVALFRRAVEAVSEMLSRRVAVNLSRSPQEALDATGCTQYTDAKVVATMPRGEGTEVEVFFFNLGRYASDDEVEREFGLRALEPVDPITLAKINQDDPTFADTHPNGTHWRDANGNWCVAAFLGWDGERRVFVDRSGLDWSGYWWFAGVRKS